MGFAGVGGLLFGLFFLIEAWRPYPFSTTNDNFLAYWPLIKEFTDSLFAAGPMHMLWSLGVGWSPWESGQVGYLYPPYYLANLIGRLFGRPMAILEISAGLHLIGTGLIAYWLLPRHLAGIARLAWALFVAIAPGALLVGLNWHPYLTPLPWYLGICLLLHRNVSATGDAAPWPWADRVVLMLFSVLMFAGAHPQLYAIGMTLAALWILAEAPPRQILRHLAILVVAQLPMVVPVIYVKLLSMNATSEMMAGRNSWDWMLRGGATLSRVAAGTLAGNLWPAGWIERTENNGIFYNPALIVVLVAAIWRRHWRLLPLLALILLMMAIATFPWMKYTGVGPFASFRWTWKLTVLAGPLMVASLLQLLALRKTGWPAWYSVTAGMLAIVAGVIVVRGLASPTLESAHDIGAMTLLHHTDRALDELGIPRGSRIAVVGRYTHRDFNTYPQPIIGVGGNSPILIGRSTAHVYEPMQPKKFAKASMELSVLWRGSVSARDYARDRERVEKRLRKLGVQYLLTAEPDVFDKTKATQTVDRHGKPVWAIAIPDPVTLAFPWAIYKKRGIEPLKQRADGTLLTLKKRKHPPKLPTPRKVHWERLKNGRWRGTPAGIAPKWIWATLACGALSLAGLLLLPRPKQAL